MYILIAILIIICFYLYQRYFPVWQVPYIDKTSNDTNNIVLLDVRDYQDATDNPVTGAVNLPYPYLKRHHHQIHGNEVVLVASDHVLKNLSIRTLKGHGFKVVGYHLVK